jgi:lysyl-tRNA synthetase, class I
MTDLASIANDSKAWPFELAKDILKRDNNKLPEKGYVLFGTGYGPSGLPHIGTYCEIVRTKMVQNAFEALSDMPTKLVVISDDMDGLRKIPDNVPNAEMLQSNIQKPLTAIPDPFGTDKSYGDHMNSKCKEFLDKFEFEYEFKSATELYKSGVYDKFLLKSLAQYDRIMSIMIPTLGEERQKTYSPFLPICPRTGRVLYVPIIDRDLEAGTVTYIDEETKEKVTIPVTGGHCKLQWKPDFGMRWAALDVDFEMYGKDHLANSKLYTQICRLIGGKAPAQFCYEMFLDEHGKKISKSKGNGITIGEWLTYAPIESLSFYMYQSPRKAKKLYFDMIPKSVDEYVNFVTKFHESSDEEKLNNPVWHVHNGKVPKHDLHGISFNLLLNLACACNPEDKSVLWGFIKQYFKGASAKDSPLLDKLADYAVKYYEDFIKPHKVYRKPTKEDVALLQDIKIKLQEIGSDVNAEEIQSIFYKAGKESHYENLRDFFKMIYEVLLGQPQGPRLGSFVLLYGIEKTKQLIESVS